MNVRDESLFERSSAWLQELLHFTRKGGPASGKCRMLDQDAHRRANALKESLDRLGKSLQAAGPPPRFLKERSPLYLRQTDPVVQEIARKVTHYGCHEDDFYALTKELAQRHGGERVSDAMLELTWVEKEHRWVRLRPETLRSLRPLIGPKPDDPEWERWWTGQGKTPPEPRGPGYPRPEKKQPREVTGSDADVAKAVQEARGKKTSATLKAMLTKARNDLKNAGAAEWIVRSAQARIKAAEEEMHRRNLEVPAEKG